MMEITTAADLRVAYDNGERVFAGANLSGAYLRGENLRWADLRGANLSGANLRWADLRGANLSGANLRWADLSGADLRWADLSGADLSWADLRGADLRWADLRWADLSGADLLVIYGLGWDVFITASTMGIGCQVHTHADWRGFDDDHIAAMAPDAAAFWCERRGWLLAECDRIAAEYAKRHGAGAVGVA